MKYARFTLVMLVSALLPCSCQKSGLPNLPQISFVGLTPNPLVSGKDTLYVEFSFTDGNAAIAYGPNPGPYDTLSRVFVRDNRFMSSGFTAYNFPPIDLSIENPKHGIQGQCLFYLFPVTVRGDSLHLAVGDTVTYEIYITDRSGDSSNHIVTSPLYIVP